MKKIWKPILIIALLAIAAGLLIFYFETHAIALFDPQGAISLQERNLMILAVSLMLVVAIPMFIVLFTFARKYRADNPKANYAPNLDHNHFVAFAFWAILITLLGTLSVINWNTTHELDPENPIVSDVPPLNIQVIALPWKFLFIYPDQGIATVNFIEFPENTPLHFVLTADAPMSSFWIPQLGSQIYAMPAMTTQLNLIANSMGDFQGMDTEINGEGFSGMKFIARSTSDNDFNEWVMSVRSSTATLGLSDYDKLAAPSEYNPVALYASVDPELYNTVVMRYMMPASDTNMAGMDMQDMDMPTASMDSTSSPQTSPEKTTAQPSQGQGTHATTTPSSSMPGMMPEMQM